MVGLPKLTDHPVVQEIAAKHGSKTTPAQILIAWGAHRGFSVIPKSVHKGKFPFISFSFMLVSDTPKICGEWNSEKADD